MVIFNMTDHKVLPNKKIIEVIVNGEVAATITQGDDGQSIRILSAHFKGVGTEEGFEKNIIIDNGKKPSLPGLPIPWLLIPFKVQPYDIVDGQIVKK